jgi:hypothetical protein
VSNDVWRALWLLSKADLRRPKESANIGVPIQTPDEIADDILRQSLREVHPQLFEHQKAVETLEKELIRTLQ